MKKIIQMGCMILVVALIFAVPASAEEDNAYSSVYFASYDSSIGLVSGSSTIRIHFDVVSNGIMEEIGVSTIELEYSPNGDAWFSAKTFMPENYPQMISEDTFMTYDYVTYTGMYDYSYRAHVTFYAKNSRGRGYLSEYTETIYIPMP